MIQKIRATGRTTDRKSGHYIVGLSSVDIHAGKGGGSTGSADLSENGTAHYLMSDAVLIIFLAG